MIPSKKFITKITAALALAATFTLSFSPQTLAQQNGATSFFGNEPISDVSTDPAKPVSRGYIVPSAQPIPGGARIAVDLYFKELNSGVTLQLQAAVNDGKGGVKVVTLKDLSVKVADNPTLYRSRREFDVSYAELNQAISKAAPNAPNLIVGPGTPLFVFAQWDVGHIWGGLSRGGLVFMPEDASSLARPGANITAATRRPTELDLAYDITSTMASPYNDPATGQGLKVGGQIRSRVEMEGKFQVPLEDFDRIKSELFELASDSAKAESVLGKEWSINAQTRYMKKDAAGNLIRDAKGLPVPDPMVDTYYDNAKFDAAKNDMAIRYRWTEGNQTGSWNFKPGMDVISTSGAVDRVEYGIDTTSDKPETIAKFIDSMNPLNPFRVIRQIVPGSTPSDFLTPALKVTDTRYKFELKHVNGAVIELSLDDVQLESLRKDKAGTGRYVQVEMDVDHLSTKSTNVAGFANGYSGTPLEQAGLATMDKSAFLDGRPVLHERADLDANSPIKQQHANDFKLATEAVIAVRDKVLGKDWLPGAQKYAIGATALDLVSRQESSKSVKALLALEARSKDSAAITIFTKLGGVACGNAFN